MAKVRNIGRQPMGFYDENGLNVVVHSGAEADIPMTEAHYAKLQSILEKCDPKPYELSGGAGGKPKAKIDDHKNEPSKSESPKAEQKRA